MQQNVIWDDISIEDHLYVFARLRGLKGAALKQDVQNMMNHLGFPEKARSAAGTLSGGQKRRLCVGISMVGGNSVVYLDEPTVRVSPHTACVMSHLQTCHISSHEPLRRRDWTLCLAASCGSWCN